MRSARASLFVALFFLSGCLSLGTQPPAQIVYYGQLGGADSTGMHSVAPGDTLYSIAQRYGLSMPDIVRVNGLQPPYGLAPGQRLKLPPPVTYSVRAGDSLYSVSRLFNVSTTQLARQNSLPAPYGLRPGQILRLPAVTAPPVQPVRVTDSYPPVEVYSSASSGVSSPVMAGRSSIQSEILPPPSSSPSPSSSSPPPETKPPVKTATVKSVAPSSVPPRAGNGKFAWPVGGPILSSYGPKKGGLHNDGINIKAPKGAPVRAADNGVVAYAGSDLKGFGNLVLIRHADRWMTAYAHMDRILVKRGQAVKMGDTIGAVGASGSVDEPQLHFEVRRGTEALNPAIYLGKPGA